MILLQIPLDYSSDRFLYQSTLEVQYTHEIAFRQEVEGNMINGVNESTIKIAFCF